MLGLALQNSVRPRSAYALRQQPADAVRSAYVFRFDQQAAGNVQVKLWVTCLPNPSTGSDGPNRWHVDATRATPAAPFSSATGTSFAALGGAQLSMRLACPTGRVLIDPGFRVKGGDPDLVLSAPRASSSLRQWEWTWLSPSPAATIAHYGACLRLVSDPSSSGVRRRLVVNGVATTLTGSHAIPAKSFAELQQSCGQLYKAAVAGFDLRGAWDSTHGWMRAYFLGMDPRIKSRAFKFVDVDTSDAPLPSTLRASRTRRNSHLHHLRRKGDPTPGRVL